MRKKLTKAAIAELRRLESDADGSLSPAALIAAARNKRSVLHRYFEWNAKKAHDLYLVEQAEKLIRYVKFEVVCSTKTVRCVKYTSTNVKGNGKEYKHVTAQPAADLLRSELARILGNIRRSSKIFEVRAGARTSRMYKAWQTMEKIEAMIAALL